jgi:predicted hydrolase (HD superfamily)
VDRGELERGAKDLGTPFDKHVQNVIRFLEPIEKDLGLGEPKPAKAKKG